MSGHSKWSTIKHKKAKEDEKRGKVFSKLSKAIIIAAREGGGNPELNIALANAVEKAKSYSMPNDNIERAIKRGTGEAAGEVIEQIMYEGYGAGGIAILVEVMTDNRNRAAADVRHVFSKQGGKIADPGSVAWMFERKGMIMAGGEGVDEDRLYEIALEAGADDIVSESDGWEIKTPPEAFSDVRSSLESNGIKVFSADVTMAPKNTVELDSENAKKVLKLIDALEDIDDVQEVYANFDIPDQIMEKFMS